MVDRYSKVAIRHMARKRLELVNPAKVGAE